MAKATAILYKNGNASFFDPNGETMDIYASGLCGIHEFLEKYPDPETREVLAFSDKPVVDEATLQNLIRNFVKLPSHVLRIGF